jgi:DNA-binding MarR family transcriptional regulator
MGRLAEPLLLHAAERASVNLPDVTSAARAVEPRATAPDSLEIIQLATELVGRIWGHFTARAAEFEMSVAEAKTVLSLEPEHAVPMRVLAARVHANPSNVTVIVARLEARGLLTRQMTADRRVRGVRLTPSGVDVRARLDARLQADHPAVARLSAAERRDLLRLLRRLNLAGG